jgi:type IV secretion system protein VirD4
MIAKRGKTDSNSKFIPRDDILLGYEQNVRRPLGFAASMMPQTPDDLPIHYGGPHLLTCAPTGSGKGRCCAVPALLDYPGQVVTIDIKGELYGCTHRRRREMGQQVIKLDPFRVVDKTTDGFNPMEMFQLPTTDFDTDSQMMASMLSEGNKSRSVLGYDRQRIAQRRHQLPGDTAAARQAELQRDATSALQR